MHKNKNWQSGKLTKTVEICLNRKILRIIKDATKIVADWELEVVVHRMEPVRIYCLMDGVENADSGLGKQHFLSMSSIIESISKHSLTQWYLYVLRRKALITPFWSCVEKPPPGTQSISNFKHNKCMYDVIQYPNVSATYPGPEVI